MKTLVRNRNLIVSIIVVMLYIYGVPGISYAQDITPPNVTPGETNTSLKISFLDPLYEAKQRAYQVQLRRKDPQGDWILKCETFTIRDSRVFRPNSTEYLFVSFTGLEPGTTYQARWRETNQSFCSDNPPAFSEWSPIGEGTTLLETLPRVEFVDANLAKAVRRGLRLDTSGEHIELLKIPKAELATLTKLQYDNSVATIRELTGLEHATQLTDLSLGRSNITDITPLAQLTQLTGLNLGGNRISDLSPLTQLTQLTGLSLGGNRISDLSPLTQLTQLTRLNLGINQIIDLSPLAQLTQLTHLNLYYNQIRDVTPLTQLVRLRTLRISSNQIRDVTPLTQLVGLETLDLSSNQIRDVTPLTQLADGALTDLNLRDNQISDVSPLVNLVYLERLWLAWNPIGNAYLLRALLDSSPKIYIDIDISKEGVLTISLSTLQPLTGATLDGAIVTLTLSSGTFDSLTKIRDAVTISGVTGITFDSTDIENVSATEVRITLTFDDNINKDTALTFTVGPEAIKNYNGPALTAELPVTGSATTETTETTETITTGATVSITPSTIASPDIGQQLELALNITGGEAVAGYQATVQFDTTALRYVLGANGDFLPAGAFFVQPVVEGNLVRLNAASLAGESNGDGTLATLTFEVIAVKASTLTLSNVLLTDSAGTGYVPNLENAQITETQLLKGDVNGDGIVDIRDLVLVASNLGKTGENKADVNTDGIVDIRDLVLVAGALGTTAAAPAIQFQFFEMFTTADIKKWLSEAQQLDLTDAASLRGIQILQRLLTTLTPKETVLLANYPNPFNPETWIPYHLAKDADVTLHIYAVNGTLVRTLTLGHQNAGLYQSRSRAAYWDGKNEFGEKVASGVYFYTLTAGDFSATRKLLIRK